MPILSVRWSRPAAIDRNRFITENTNQQINELVGQYFADDNMSAEDAAKRFGEVIANSD